MSREARGMTERQPFFDPGFMSKGETWNQSIPSSYLQYRKTGQTCRKSSSSGENELDS